MMFLILGVTTDARHLLDTLAENLHLDVIGAQFWHRVDKSDYVNGLLLHIIWQFRSQHGFYHFYGPFANVSEHRHRVEHIGHKLTVVGYPFTDDVVLPIGIDQSTGFAVLRLGIEG